MPEPLPLRLYFMRHGETAWSITSRHTSTTDLPLTDRGEQEALRLQGNLSAVTFTRVFTSPRRRARKTCALAGLAVSAEIAPDLAEWDYGDYESRHSADIRKARPDWDLFRDGCPGGEGPKEVRERADRLIAHLRTLSGNIALFSHGQFGCCFAARWIGLPVEDGQHFVLGTGSISILGYDPHHPEVPVLAQWNSIPEAPREAASDASIGFRQSMKKRAIERWENEGGEVPLEGKKSAISTDTANRAEIIEEPIGPSMDE